VAGWNKANATDPQVRPPTEAEFEAALANSLVN
jgi:hypothetical protein